MSYLQPSNKKGKKNNRLTIGAVFLVCLFVFLSVFLPDSLFNLSYGVFSPFWKLETFVVEKFARGFELLSSKEVLVRENESLKKSLASQESISLSLDTALSENSSLKELLGRGDKFKYVLGVVVRKPPFSPYDTLIIDAGSISGVKVGNKVFAPDNMLLGDVVEVYESSAKVSLFSTAGREIPVVVGDKNIGATAIGRGGGNFYIELPSGAEIAQGDSIKSPSLGVSVLGVVSSIFVDKSDSLKIILFKSPFNMNDLYFVKVETDDALTTN